MRKEHAARKACTEPYTSAGNNKHKQLTDVRELQRVEGGLLEGEDDKHEGLRRERGHEQEHDHDVRRQQRDEEHDPAAVPVDDPAQQRRVDEGAVRDERLQVVDVQVAETLVVTVVLVDDVGDCAADEGVDGRDPAEEEREEPQVLASELRAQRRPHALGLGDHRPLHRKPGQRVRLTGERDRVEREEHEGHDQTERHQHRVAQEEALAGHAVDLQQQVHVPGEVKEPRHDAGDAALPLRREEQHELEGADVDAVAADADERVAGDDGDAIPVCGLAQGQQDVTHDRDHEAQAHGQARAYDIQRKARRHVGEAQTQEGGRVDVLQLDLLAGARDARELLARRAELRPLALVHQQRRR
ncbi:hypothetical protein ON010_g10948 [Phytophthora cinnamomi]|nr:hypothetical protein ON010_g10948 [Phytophthora cinnamomi]